MIRLEPPRSIIARVMADLRLTRGAAPWHRQRRLSRGFNALPCAFYLVEFGLNLRDALELDIEVAGMTFELLERGHHAIVFRPADDVARAGELTQRRFDVRDSRVHCWPGLWHWE